MALCNTLRWRGRFSWPVARSGACFDSGVAGVNFALQNRPAEVARSGTCFDSGVAGVNFASQNFSLVEAALAGR